jgi:hypothetical protein
MYKENFRNDDIVWYFFNRTQVANEKSNVTYSDAIYTQGIQTIPGWRQCEYYDLGGGGIAFHDTDTSNNGSENLKTAKHFCVINY